MTAGPSGEPVGRSASGWGVRGEGFAPVSIITVSERREAKGLDAHVPLILRDDALYDPDLDRFFLDLPLSGRSEEHTSELQSLMRISYAVFCLKKKNNYINSR